MTVILDCCHAGTATKQADDDLVARYLPKAAVGRRGKVDEPWRDLRGTTKGLGQRRAALFACQAQQQAYERRFRGEGEATRAGQFSHFLFEGLRGAAADTDGDAVVSNQEALDYSIRRLDETFNQGRSATERQEPLLEADAPDAAWLK